MRHKHTNVDPYARYALMLEGDIATLPCEEILEITKSPNGSVMDPYVLLRGVVKNQHVQTVFAAQVARVRSYAADLPPLKTEERECFSAHTQQRLKDIFARFASFGELAALVNAARAIDMQKKGYGHVNGLFEMRVFAALLPPPQKLRDRFFLKSAPTEDLDEYRNNVRLAFLSLPGFLFKLVDEAGYIVNVAERLSHINPFYSTPAPFSETGQPYEACAAGIHASPSRQIDMPQFLVTTDKQGVSSLVKVNQTREKLEFVAAHEAFHALDYMLDSHSTYTKAFMEAYEADLREIRSNHQAGRITDETFKSLAYFLPKYIGGKHEKMSVAAAEAFAETGAEIVTQKTIAHLAIHFPRVTSYMQGLVRTVKYVYENYPTGTELQPASTASLPDLRVVRPF